MEINIKGVTINLEKITKEDIEELINKIEALEQQNSQLQRKIYDFIALLEACKTLNSELSMDKALEQILLMATNLVKARASSLLMVNDETGELEFKIAHGVKSKEIKRFKLKIGEGIAGWVAEHNEPVVINNAGKDARLKKEIGDLIQYSTESMICAPIANKNKKVIGVIQILNKMAGGEFSEDDLQLLVNLSAQAAIAIENAQLYEDLNLKKHLEYENIVAFGIQKSLTATHVPIISGLDNGIISIPSKSVNGDYFDVIDFQNNSLIIGGYTTGEGLVPTLLMLMIRSIIKSSYPFYSDAAAFMKNLNSYLLNEVSDTDIDMYLGLLIYDKAARSFKIGGTGLNPIFYYNSAEKKLQHVQLPQTSLGKNEDLSLDYISLSPKKGDLILLFSRGYDYIFRKSVKNANYDTFLDEVLINTMNSPASDIAQELFSVLMDSAFKSEIPQTMDISVHVIKIKDE